MEEEITVFSLFAGVEGLGMLIPNHVLVGLSEWDKYASMVLKYHYPSVKNYGDISKIDWSLVPDFDLLTGGSPCQDFSVAGKRRGLSGARSSLAWEYIRALRDKKPSHFIWENVEGALSSRGGWDFANLLVAFSESGYSLWWQVLNAKDFGVAQNRTRIFVFGTRSDIPSPQEVFFEPGSEEESVGEAIKQRVGNTLTKRSAGGYNRRGNYIRQLNGEAHQTERVYDPAYISPALNTGTGGNHTPFVKIPEATAKGFAEAKVGQSINLAFPNSKTRRGRVSDVAQTLDWGMQQYTLTDTDEIRRLMPIECERLMGWPDDWTRWGTDGKGDTIEMSDTQRYSMCGNGAVPYHAQAIISHLL